MYTVLQAYIQILFGQILCPLLRNYFKSDLYNEMFSEGNFTD